MVKGGKGNREKGGEVGKGEEGKRGRGCTVKNTCMLNILYTVDEVYHSRDTLLLHTVNL